MPRPGDVFEYALDAAAALAYGTPLYYSTGSEDVTDTAGNYVLGYAVGMEHYPQKQRHLTDDAAGDSGTTIANTSYARMTICESASIWSKLQKQGHRLDLGDAGGFSGMLYSAADTELQFYVDGTKVGSIGTDGSWDDEVT